MGTGEITIVLGEIVMRVVVRPEAVQKPQEALTYVVSFDIRAVQD